MGITQTAFAALVGVSQQAISKRIRTGTLSTLPDGTLDPETAAAEWAAIPPRAIPRASPPLSLLQPGPAPPDSPAPSPPPPPPPSFEPARRAERAERIAEIRPPRTPVVGPEEVSQLAKAKIVRAVAEARLKQLDYEARSGEVVKAADVADGWLRIMQMIRASIMSLPARLAPELATMSDVHAVRVRLDLELREALRALGDEIARAG